MKWGFTKGIPNGKRIAKMPEKLKEKFVKDRYITDKDELKFIEYATKEIDNYLELEKALDYFRKQKSIKNRLKKKKIDDIISKLSERDIK